MSNNWTPGPWIARTRSLSGGPLGGEGANACAVTRELKPGFDLDPTYVVAERLSPANAHLIAAAPELYEVLDEILSFSSDVSAESMARWDALIVRARAALAKARGEQ